MNDDLIRKKTMVFTLPAFALLVLFGCKTLPQGPKLPPEETVRQEEVLPTDSLSPVFSLLQQELAKAGDFNYRIIEDYSGLSTTNSFNFLITSRIKANSVFVPAALKGYNPEGYYIKSSKNQVCIIGNSVLALQEAVFDYLEQLGFRYYLPGTEWQIVPAIQSPFIPYEKLTQPDYLYRHFANGHGYNKNKALQDKFEFWYKANRLGGSFPVSVGHAYQVIVANNKETFKEHPEYFATEVKKGELPLTPKFDVSNANLVQLVKQDAAARIKEARRIGQQANMISMEPSDGGGFCNTAACENIGTVSDQVFYLTNEVARYIQHEYPGVWVGNLAYNEHILPTKFKLEPNVFVMVTNGFNRSQFSTNQLLSLWSKKAAKLGVYEYLNVYEWDNDLPGRSNASQLNYLKKSIGEYYENGARVYMAETNIGWISKGLGQYLATKLLWNYKVNIDSISKDFYSKCFGNAADDIKKLYDSWENAPKGFLSDNLMADWMDLVAQAEMKTNDKAVLLRIYQIKIYLHYLFLYRSLRTNPSVSTVNDVLIFANRTFETAAFSTMPVLASLPKYVGFPALGIYGGTNQEWRKHTDPVTILEMNSLFSNDKRSIKRIAGLKNFTASSSFVEIKEQDIPVAFRNPRLMSTFIGNTRFILRITKQSSANYIEMMSDFSARPEKDKAVSIRIYNYQLYNQIKEEADILLEINQTAKKTKEKFSLAKLAPGDYVLEADDQLKIFNISFFGDIFYNVEMTAGQIVQTSTVAGLNNFYFLVPAGVQKILVHKSKVAKLKSPKGRIIDLANNKDGAYTIDILAGEEGLWSVFYQGGNLFIEGVPPYLGIEPEKFLIPDREF